jgi:hypothetical protein
MLASRNTKLSLLFTLCVLLPAVIPALFAQSPSQGGEQAATLKGTVENVAIVPAYGRTETHLKLKSGNQLVDVNLGPTRWLDANEFSVATGDTVQVEGTKAGQVFNATQVISGDRRLDLQGGPGTWASSGPSGRGYCRGAGCGGGYGYCRGGGCGNGGNCPGCGGSRGGCMRGWW